MRIKGAGATNNGAIAVIATATPTLSGPVTLIGDATVTVSSTSAVTFNNANSFTSVANENLTLTGGSGAGAGGLISGVIALNAGGITKNQSGKWVLTGANTYSGTTTVNAGTLLLNNTTGSGTGSGAVTVNGGTLGGTGAIAGPVTVNTGGTLSPGASIESLATGAVTFNAGATFTYEINSTSVTGDLLDSSGSLTIDTAGTGVALSLLDLGADIKIADGTKLTMIAYDGTWNGGTFVGAPNLGVVTVGLNNQFRIRYADTAAGGNFAGETIDNARFVTLTAVPELSSIVSVGLGGLFAIGAVWLGRRFGFNALHV